MPVIQNFQAFMDGGGLVCPPNTKKIEYGLADEKGLFVECRASATAVPTWYLRLKNGKGTNTYRKLGTVKDISLAQARKLVKQLRTEHAVTAKTNTEKNAVPEKSEIILNDFMKLHAMPYFYAHLRSAKKYEQLFRIHVGPRFGNIRVRDVTRRDVEAFHNELLKMGQSPASADHSLKLLKRIMTLCEQWQFIDRNVLKGVPLFNVFNGAETYLKEPEVQRLIEVLKAESSNNMIALLLLFILSCGCRRSAAMLSKWSEIDLEKRVWKIPALNSKSRRAVSVPLNDSIMYVLGQVNTFGKSEYVFVNKATGKPFVSIMKSWRKYRSMAGLSDKVRIHDLRHTWGSMLASQGISLYEISILMQHADQRSSARYAHVSMDRLQQTSNLGSRIVKSPAQQPAVAVALSDVGPQEAKPRVAVAVTDVVVLQESANDSAAVMPTVETQEPKAA